MLTLATEYITIYRQRLYQKFRGRIGVFSLQKLMGHADLQELWRCLKQTHQDIREAHHTARRVDNGG